MFSGLACLLWKLLGRRSSAQRPNQLPTRPPLIKSPSVDGLLFP